MSARLTVAIRIGDAAYSLLRKTQSFPEQKFEDHKEWKDHEHVGVEPMLLALSMELALKAWIAFDHDNPEVIYCHNLIKLFNKLKPESQQKLDDEFKKTVVPNHPGFFHVDYGIRDLLTQHKNAFTDWRYLHEAKDSMMFDQYEFESALEMVLREFRKRYRVEQITPPRSF